MRSLARLLVLSFLFLGACGGGAAPGPCAAGARSLEIVDPVEGDALAASRYVVLVQTCGLEPDEMIVLRALQPIESDYGFATVSVRDELVRFDVPLLPGTMELDAQLRDGSVRSEPVTFTSAPP